MINADTAIPTKKPIKNMSLSLCLAAAGVPAFYFGARILGHRRGPMSNSRS